MSRNEFIYLKQVCIKYYDLFKEEMNITKRLSDIQKERYGFYFYILKLITREDDFEVLCNMINDCDFNHTIFDNADDDRGVDAVYIDDEQHIINLFNFKYRENFEPNSGQNDTDLRSSSKFIYNYMNEDFKSLSGKTKNFCERISDILKGKEHWEILLYYVSNESNPLNDKNTKKEFFDTFDVKINCISLKEISVYSSKEHMSIDAKIGVSVDELMPFRESPKDTKTSFIVNLPIAELLRITCNDDDYRKQLEVNDVRKLKKSSLDMNVLYENVRGFLGETPYNKSIVKTLNEDSTKFFLYNNGITMTASKIESTFYNANKNIELDLYNIQVVNGGQTLKILSEYLESHDELKPLIDGRVLVRIYMVGSYQRSCDNKLGNAIAKYTNSQNKIRNIDLKSLDDVQFDIEKILDEYNILYDRKRGSTGLSFDKKYLHEISFEKFGQILWAIQGNPHKSANQKAKIYDEFYDEIFKSQNFLYEKTPEYVKSYFKIKKDLRGKGVDEQRIFYIIYINYKYSYNNNCKCLDYINKKLDEYSSKDDAPKRPLITSDFKKYIDDNIAELVPPSSTENSEKAT